MFEDDFLNEETKSYIDRFEKMLRNGGSIYFEAEVLEIICDYYLEQNNAHRALQAGEYGISQYPGENIFKIKIAEAYLIDEKFSKALEWAQQAESFEPFDPDTQLILGEIHLALEETEIAETYFLQSIEYTDEKMDFQFEIAYICIDYNNFPFAIRMMEAILSEFPDNEQALLDLAACYEMSGKTGAAIQAYIQLIDSNPYNTVAWYNLGVTYANEERYVEALEAFDFCLVTDETYFLARFNKANCFVELERYEEAIETYQSVIEKEGVDSITLCNLGGCYERLNRLSEARENYYQASLLNPQIAEAWFGIGLTYEKESRHKEALAYFRRAVLLEPENGEYQLALGESLYHNGLQEEASEVYGKLLEDDPGMEEAWLDYSFILFKKGEVDMACDLMREAIKSDPENAIYFYRLCCYTYAIGKRQESITYLEVALVLNFSEHFSLFELNPEMREDTEFMQIIEQNRPD